MGRIALTIAASAMVALAVAVGSIFLVLLAPPAGIAVGLFVVVGILYFMVAMVVAMLSLAWLGATRFAYAVATAGRRVHVPRVRGITLPRPPRLHWHQPHHSH